MTTERGTTNVKAPPHLSPDARDLWRTVLAGWDLDAASLVVLRSACEALARVEEARRLLKREGIVLRDHHGRRVAHPAVVIERDARLQFLRAWRQLGLDLEPPGQVGRPAGRS